MRPSLARVWLRSRAREINYSLKSSNWSRKTRSESSISAASKRRSGRSRKKMIEWDLTPIIMTVNLTWSCRISREICSYWVTKISSSVSHYRKKRYAWWLSKKATMKSGPWFNRIHMRVKGWSRLTLVIISSLRKCSGSETNPLILFILRRDKWLTKALQHRYMSMEDHLITGYQTKTIW